MKSRIELDIDVPQAKAADLLADPGNSPEWMDDLERIEPISGDLGEPGSVYRMVPKRGTMMFDATVVGRALPTSLRLSLVAGRVSVSITDTFLRLSERKTHLISEEVFTFKGAVGQVMGFLGRPAIRRAHRRHMEAFKRYAESHAT